MDEFFNPALIPQETTLFAIWLLGLSMGLTACMDGVHIEDILCPRMIPKFLMVS